MKKQILTLDHNYLHFNIRSLTIFGMWNPYRGMDRYKYTCYATALFVVAGMMQTSAEVVHTWTSRKDIVMFTKHFTIVTGMASTMIKVANLWRCRNDLDIAIDLINWERRRLCNRKFAIYRDRIVTSTIRACRLFSLTFIVMVLWYSIFIYGKLLVYHKENVDMLPLRPLLPLRSNQSSIYWLLFVFDQLTFFYVAGTVASHDSLFMVFLIHIGAQLDLLKSRLKSCQGKIGDVYNEDHIEEDRYTTNNLKIECLCRTVLQETLLDPIVELHTCIEHHQKILRFVNLVQDIFNNTLLLQFASSLLMITMIGFQLIGERELSRNELIETVSLLICALFQLFLYCWFGTVIISKSEGISLSAYSSKWYIADERFKSSLKILLWRGQIPIKLRAGYICELSSSTFMSIMSKCYSFMALLQQVNE